MYAIILFVFPGVAAADRGGKFGDREAKERKTRRIALLVEAQDVGLEVDLSLA